MIKKKPQQVFEKFKNLIPGNVGISSITLAELQYGINKSSRPDKNQIALDQFISPLEIAEFNSNTAVEYGKIRASLESKGTPIGALDTLIAAPAKNLGTILVTNNEKEFKRVDGLKIENWVEN